MYVCICRAVTLTRVRDTICGGAATVDAVERKCGAGGDCGTCRAEIQGIILEHKNSPCQSCPNAGSDKLAARAA